MKRLHRLTALLVKLQSSKTLEIKKIADEYEVSERTIYRDLKALEEAGVPIGYEPGEGYFLLEGYRLPPVHLSVEEGYALITAQAIINQNKDASLVSTFARAVEKITAVLRTHDKDKALDLKNRVKPSINTKISNSNFLMTVQRSITDFRVLDLDYQNAQGICSNRTVEPLAIYFTQQNWILVAYCRLRKENREFRLDRIQQLREASERFAPNSFDLNYYFKKVAERQNP